MPPEPTPMIISARQRRYFNDQLQEMQGKYDNLTQRIAAIDKQLATEMDQERKLTLENRRQDYADGRAQLMLQITDIEAKLAQQPEPVLNPLPVEPYDGFHGIFREVVAAERIPETGGMLHVVFGSIAKIREIPIVLPINQAFDFKQRGSRSVLASFEDIVVNGRPFFDEIEDSWPVAKRPKAAGLGHTKYLPLPQNANNLPGVLFVVTTRDLSNDLSDYGRYVNTPIEGIDLIMDRAMEAATAQKLTSIAMPLLGAGYANIRRTSDDAKLGRLLRQSVTLLAVQRLQDNIRLESSRLRRAIIVIYSQRPHSEEEHALWNSVTRFLGSRTDRSAQIDELLKEINKLLA